MVAKLWPTHIGGGASERFLLILLKVQDDVGILRRNDILFAEYGLLARCHEQGERKKQILLHNGSVFSDGNYGDGT